MCGRASLTTPPEELAELFKLDEVPPITPRWNVAPGQPIAILRSIPGEPGARRIEHARWGLSPREARPDGKKGAPMILARVESAFAWPAVRDAALHRRCLVLVDGFYEWRGEKKHRQPFHFKRRDGRPFALAAVWDEGADGAMECAILTTRAQPPVLEVHDRMPIAIAAKDHDAWLDPAITTPDAAKPLAAMDPTCDLVAEAVSTFVNDATHEGPECAAPAPQATLF